MTPSTAISPYRQAGVQMRTVREMRRFLSSFRDDRTTFVLCADPGRETERTSPLPRARNASRYRSPTTPSTRPSRNVSDG